MNWIITIFIMVPFVMVFIMTWTNRLKPSKKAYLSSFTIAACGTLGLVFEYSIDKNLFNHWDQIVGIMFFIAFGALEISKTNNSKEKFK